MKSRFSSSGRWCRRFKEIPKLTAQVQLPPYAALLGDLVFRQALELLLHQAKEFYKADIFSGNRLSPPSLGHSFFGQARKKLPLVPKPAQYSLFRAVGIDVARDIDSFKYRPSLAPMLHQAACSLPHDADLVSAVLLVSDEVQDRSSPESEAAVAAVDASTLARANRVESRGDRSVTR